MPTKRTRRTRGRSILTPRDFTLTEVMDFVIGWSPPTSDFERSRTRWETWIDFLADWQRVRDQWDPTLGIELDDTFAEWLYQKWGLDGPPEMEPLPKSYPSEIPFHPVLAMYRSESDSLDKLRNLKGVRR